MSDTPLGSILAALVVLLGLTAGACYAVPKYNVWQQGLRGQAELARAEQNRKIKVSEALAMKDAAVALAQAEVERARGVAEANEIIGQSLKNNEAYLRYLWINGLQTNQMQVVYVPTEAGLPVLEAGAGRWRTSAPSTPAPEPVTQ